LSARLLLLANATTAFERMGPAVFWRRGLCGLMGVWLLACTDSGGHLVSAAPIAASAPVPGASQPPGPLLPLEVDARLAEQFVRIGFGLEQGFQATAFLTPRLRTAQAAPLIRLVKAYNEFQGEPVAAAVAALRGRVSGVEFGREGSPVLYLELPHWTHQREETAAAGPGSRIPDAEHDQFVAELRRVFVTGLKADEFSVDRRRVRIWWD
jgi:hypothetical protein